jgi:hypothetical protein
MSDLQAATDLSIGRRVMTAAGSDVPEVAGCPIAGSRLAAGRSALLASLRSASLTTHPPLRGVRVVSDQGTDRPAGVGSGMETGESGAGEGAKDGACGSYGYEGQ